MGGLVVAATTLPSCTHAGASGVQLGYERVHVLREMLAKASHVSMFGLFRIVLTSTMFSQ